MRPLTCFICSPEPADKIVECIGGEGGEGEERRGEEGRVDGEDVNSNDDDAECSGIKPCRVIR